MAANIGRNAPLANLGRGMGAALLLSVAGAAWAANAWTERLFPADGFAITAAKAPFRENRQVQTAAGPAEVHSYAFFPGPVGVAFVVTVTVKNAGDGRTDAQLIEDAVNDADDKPEAVEQAGLAGKEFTYRRGDTDTLVRLFTKDGRLFQLMISGPTSAFPHPYEALWMNSWHPVPVQVTP